MLKGRLVHFKSTDLKSFKQETHAAGVMAPHFCPEYRGRIYLRKICTFPPNYTWHFAEWIKFNSRRLRHSDTG